MNNTVDKVSEKGFTVYSKSGCPDCRRVKDLLKTSGYTALIVDCDEVLLENREDFLEYLRNCGVNRTVFPFVFFDNEYLGGYENTLKHLQKLELDQCFS